MVCVCVPGTYCSTRSQFPVSNWLQRCVTSNKPTPSLEVQRSTTCTEVVFLSVCLLWFLLLMHVLFNISSISGSCLWLHRPEMLTTIAVVILKYCLMAIHLFLLYSKFKTLYLIQFFFKLLSMYVFLLTGKRPFGVSLLYMGWDKHYGFQLYQSDPSGNYGGWKATCIGNNSAVSLSDVLQSACSVPCSNCIMSVGCIIASGDTRGRSCTLQWPWQKLDSHNKQTLWPT